MFSLQSRRGSATATCGPVSPEETAILAARQKNFSTTCHVFPIHKDLANNQLRIFHSVQVKVMTELIDF
jgi:hypothetical protein